ncbi:uncharacterized protein CANTADRAFT_25967 [Suhomyces tanzawaensis NRRL Y-17324]|uniref:Defect at low temperature protein 1 n=1 Tax=Suhomyces tanzawaensis NRRL Y-17324 TaxID=984487 RepID=A0A1E4SLG6_9ASCO|nr:uncharacterized protein CANTADRAFT_25967 [Suhomyces tanzawaensis NRRL Y-17324]ODV80375.1 hypothetical protein CANTADRAFT_25967 [Suhomyces tanzawaensis NRRL Y-17324]
MTNTFAVDPPQPQRVTYEPPRDPMSLSQASRPSPQADSFSDHLRLRSIPVRQEGPSLSRAGSRYQTSTFHGTKTSTTVMGIWTGSDSKRIFNIPKRVFQWIYSISLALLVIIMLSFVAVTPIDVIVQTTASSSPAVKVFIVIIVCVVFLVASMFWYFVRIFHVRMALNDIPSKSVYVPFQGDLPKDAVKMIDDNLRRCIGEIKLRAGPLYNEDVILNHPGMAPPEYIQRRNRKRLERKTLFTTEKQTNNHGTSLPPKSNYQDIIRSIGDKFMHGGGRVLTEVEIPHNFSMREIVIYLARIYMDPENMENQDSDFVRPNLKRTIELYEKFRFGPDLIKEPELWEFMINFDRLARVCLSDYHERIKKTRPGRSKVDQTQEVIEQSMKGQAYVGRSDASAAHPFFYDEDDSGYNTDAGENYQGNRDDSSTLESVINPNERAKNYSANNLTVDGWNQRDNTSFISGTSRTSGRVLIKDKLAIRRDSSSKRLTRLGLLHVQLSFDGDLESVKRRNSGYITDNEEGEEGEEKNERVFGSPEIEDDDEDDDELDIYNFRFRGRGG